MPEAEKWSQNEPLAEKRSFEVNGENLMTIYQPRALSSDILASRKMSYLFYNPPINFSRGTHVDLPSLHILSIFFVFLGAKLTISFMIFPSLASAVGFFFFRFSRPIKNFSPNVCSFPVFSSVEIKSDGY